VVSADVPEGSEVELQIHERTFLDDLWITVAWGRLTDDPELRATLSAWYRLAFHVPGARPNRVVRACVESID
jgi:hypothetical protein